MKRTLIVLCAPGGLGVAEGLLRWLGGQQLGELRLNPGDLPPAWEPAVTVFVVDSPDLGGAELLLRAVGDLHVADHPLCLLVPDLGTYRFDALAPPLAVFSERNALAWSDEPRILQTARLHLGLDPPALRRDVLLSYARKDGAAVCDAIKRHLEAHNYRVFRDTDAIAGGELVQREIDAAIERLDFVLYLESRAAGESRWVEHELHTARRLQVPIARVRRRAPAQQRHGALRRGPRGRPVGARSGAARHRRAPRRVHEPPAPGRPGDDMSRDDLAGLAGPTLLFSASVPRELADTSLADRAQDLIVHVVGGVLRAGGRVVFGGHPTITPQVHHLLSAWRLPPSAVRLHQLRCFADEAPWQTFDRAVFPDISLHGAATPWAAKTLAERSAELGELRDAMAAAADAAFFVGGQLPEHSLGGAPGLADEFARFRAAHPKGPVFLSSLLRGYTAAVLIPDARAGRLDLCTPLSPPEQRVLEETDSLEVLAGLTLAGLRRAARVAPARA